MGLVLSKSSGAKGYLNYGRGFDSDAVTFLTTTGITNIVQQKAVNDLVIDLKGYGIWVKSKALYPFVGGTSARHAVNLKTPGTYNLTFTGGWLHSANGALPNGSSDYANTSLSKIVLTEYSTHLSYYSRTDSNNVAVDMGMYGSGANTFNLLISYSDVFYLDMYNYSTNRITTSNVNSTGFYLGTRTAIDVMKAFKNGSQFSTTNTNTSSGWSSLTGNITIGARNDLPIGNYSDRQCAFASIGDGLTDTEAANFYTAVQKFQTTLGRQV